MNPSMLLQSQLLATKFYIPTASGTLISRPRLSALLEEGLKHPFTLISAPAGFGKTTFLSIWAHSLQAPHARLCWISLDEEDNDPCLFWTYVLTALHAQGFYCCESLLIHLQSQPPPPLKSLLTTLVNLLAESQDHFVLILDDYQRITQEQVHTTLAYLVEHLPVQLRIVLSTRADPPLPLPLLRARQRALEVRTDQLRCTVDPRVAQRDDNKQANNKNKGISLTRQSEKVKRREERREKKRSELRGGAESGWNLPDKSIEHDAKVGLQSSTRRPLHTVSDTK